MAAKETPTSLAEDIASTLLEMPEPTDAEIAAIVAEETRAQAVADKAPAPSKRGPGRPPGAKNKATAAKASAARATGTTVTTARPLSGAAAASAARAGNADRDARARVRDERQREVKRLTAEMLSHRTTVVRAVGMATGLPPQFLVGQAVDAATGQVIIDGDTGLPEEALTVYGQQLAPAEWQVKTCVEAYVRLEETDAGKALVEKLDKWMPYMMMAGAVGAFGIYTMTVFTASQAIKPMIAAEIAAQSGQPAPDVPGGTAG